MNNVLLVGKSLTFPQAMRVAEGMSYQHEQVIVKARGKQIQKAVEIAIRLQVRGRAVVCATEVGYVVNEEVQMPSITITLKSDGVAS